MCCKLALCVYTLLSALRASSYASPSSPALLSRCISSVVKVLPALSRSVAVGRECVGSKSRIEANKTTCTVYQGYQLGIQFLCTTDTCRKTACHSACLHGSFACPPPEKKIMAVAGLRSDVTGMMTMHVWCLPMEQW